MDTKSKSFSHSLFAKALAFIIAIVCFTGAIYSFIDMVSKNRVGLDLLFKDNYYESQNFTRDIQDVVSPLQSLSSYKSEEHIKSGGTVTDSKLSYKKDALYSDFEMNSSSYDPNLSYEENYAVFEKAESEKIAKLKDEVISDDLHAFKLGMEALKEAVSEGLLYYYSDGEVVFSNTDSIEADDFKSYPLYLMSERGITNVYPLEAEVALNNFSNNFGLFSEQGSSTVYIAFKESALEKKTLEFEKKRDSLREDLLKTAGFLMGLLASFIYLLVVVGRNSFKDDSVHLSRFDKLYNDINLFLCFTIIGIWFVLAKNFVWLDNLKMLIVPTALLGSIGLLLVLSMVKHIKNRSFLKHTLVYTLGSKFFGFFKSVYNSGSVAVKVVSVAIAYPLLVAATFFMFPVTIGLGAWFAYKKAKEFLAVSDGVSKIKSGDIRHTIELSGDGEFKKLADDINSLKDGLGAAIESELKSERLKTELITNVSHDIRTPLTSIITYIDLLKSESDPSKRSEYLTVLEQKSQRLKTLTDDLFEAAKASSGSIPVELQKIDIVSLLKQGFAELDSGDRNLEFKADSSFENLFVMADGKLLWRSIENLLSNVFKYALPNSRVYLDFSESQTDVFLTIKNISSYELNISSEELMERFKRGDESRTSEGSGLGLSIAKSLLEAQHGSLVIEIDGDLFKAIVKIPKYSQ